MKALTKVERQSLFNKFGGKCAYCGCDLPARWHADHLKPIERKLTHQNGGGFVQTGEAWRPENHAIENMMPACPPCNISKATLDLDGWRKWLEGHVRSLNAHNTPYRLAKAYGFVKNGESETAQTAPIAKPEEKPAEREKPRSPSTSAATRSAMPASPPG